MPDKVLVAPSIYLSLHLSLTFFLSPSVSVSLSFSIHLTSFHCHFFRIQFNSGTIALSQHPDPDQKKGPLTLFQDASYKSSCQSSEESSCWPPRSQNVSEVFAQNFIGRGLVPMLERGLFLLFRIHASTMDHC